MGWRLLLRFIAGRLRNQVGVYKQVMKDPRTPRPAKFLLGLSVGYMVLPFDIIPDFIPILGQLDDALIIPTLIGAAFLLIPRDVLKDARDAVKQNQLSGKS